MSDVAGLVERLKRVMYTRERGDGPNGTYFDEPCEADDRDAIASFVNPDGPAAASAIKAQAAEIERLEAKLREAVEEFKIIVKYHKEADNHKTAADYYYDIARAFLATMEKPHE